MYGINVIESSLINNECLQENSHIFESLAKNDKDKACEVLKIKEFAFLIDCFHNERNAVFGVFLQRLTNNIQMNYKP